MIRHLQLVKSRARADAPGPEGPGQADTRILARAARILRQSPLTWIGLPADEARALAALLTAKANDLERKP